jgi:hypothetical protein
MPRNRPSLESDPSNNGMRACVSGMWEALTPKGLRVPYMEFRDFGKAAVNAINFWIF